MARALTALVGARAGTARGDLNLVAGRLRRDLVDRRISTLSERLAAAWKMAGLVHPDRPLDRGFARVNAADGGRTLTSAAAAREAVRLELHFRDGAVRAAIGDSASVVAPVERKRRKSHIASQPGLFDPAEE